MSQTASLQWRLRERLEREPEGRALGFVRSDGGCDWLTFAETCGRAAAVGACLEENGLSRGEVCVLALPSEELAPLALLGVLMAGGVPVLAAPPIVRGLHSNLEKVLRHVIATSGARVVLCDDRDDAGLDTLRSQFPETGFVTAAAIDPRQPSEPVIEQLPDPTEIAALQLTSGTTGFPRLCVWEQRAVLAAVDGMHRAMALAPDDVCLNWTPLYHDMGLVNNFLLCMLSGVPLALLETLEFLKRPGLWLRALDGTGATVTWSPNFGFALATERARPRDLEGVRLGGVRAFWNAAERIHPETVAAFYRRFRQWGVRREALKTNFGCAENVGGATFSSPEGGFRSERIRRRPLHEQREARLAGPSDPESETVEIVGVGRPFEGCSAHILSSSGEELPDGRVGEITLDTPSLMQRYLGDDAATRQAIVDGRLRTGDLGYKRGSELFWIGRRRERINLQGRKYDPSDFESALLRVDGVRTGCFAVFGVDDGRTGTERLVVVTELRRGRPLPTDELIDEIRGRVMTEIGVPVADVVLVAEGSMTKTSSGKRRHQFYRGLYEAGRLEALGGKS